MDREILVAMERLDIFKREFGPDLHTAQAAFELACLFANAEMFESELEILRYCFNLRDSLLPRNHPDVVKVCLSLGCCLMKMGNTNIPEAKMYIDCVLHSETEISMDHILLFAKLGEIFAIEMNFPLAITYFEFILRMQKVLYSPIHICIAQTNYRLACLHRDSNQLHQAYIVCQEAFDIYSIVAPGSSDCLDSCNLLMILRRCLETDNGLLNASLQENAMTSQNVKTQYGYAEDNNADDNGGDATIYMELQHDASTSVSYAEAHLDKQDLLRSELHNENDDANIVEMAIVGGTDVVIQVTESIANDESLPCIGNDSMSASEVQSTSQNIDEAMNDDDVVIDSDDVLSTKALSTAVYDVVSSNDEVVSDVPEPSMDDVSILSPAPISTTISSMRDIGININGSVSIMVPENASATSLSRKRRSIHHTDTHHDGNSSSMSTSSLNSKRRRKNSSSKQQVAARSTSIQHKNSDIKRETGGRRRSFLGSIMKFFML